MSQWAKTNDLADDSIANDSINDIPDDIIYGQVPNGRNYTRYIYYDSYQQIIMEKYIVEDMGHAWSGGACGENYTDPTGPNQSQIFWDFFNRVSNNKKTL